MIGIELPTLNTNDSSYTLVEWLVPDGSNIKGEQPLAVVETSKASEEIESTGPGILHVLVDSGQDCTPGQVIAYLFESAEERDSYRAASAAQAAQPPSAGAEPDITEPNITRAARALADRHGLSDTELRGLGRTVIRTADVEGLVRRAAPASPAPQRRLSKRQRAVGAVVTESMRTVPAAAAYAKVDAGPAEELARRLSERTGSFVSLPVLLVKAVARRLAGHPLMFAALTDDDAVREAERAHVGVTMDAGRGLYTPVVHDAAQLDSDRIADILTGFRSKAFRGTFQAAELAGANIMVAPHTTEGLILATPIVFPGQTCVVSVGAVDDQVVLDAAGTPRARRFAHLGLVYDHRVVNGGDAMAFLKDLKEELEAPAALG
ncbi:2-oxo acid dehydrogenase subunit E2 [Streptomyces sp. NPDC023723]|uniref:2-oxo acid dehydrogenase subunit E2 n=1 Tax=Streptomyces sp. NPDC023723 TaxID=3154323 RepID=UPI0033E2811D